MKNEKYLWLDKAQYNLRLCEWFTNYCFFPDAQSLNTFLKRPYLTISALSKQSEIFSSKDEALELYHAVNDPNSNDYINLDEADIDELLGYYEKGMSPEQAAIAMIKEYETRKEAKKHVHLINSSSSSPLLVETLFTILLGFITVFVVINIIYYLVNKFI